MNKLSKTKSALIIAALTVTFAAQSATANMGASSSRNLPQTSALEREIDLAQQALSSTSSRLARLQSSARDARKKAEEVASMVKRIKSIESQIYRTERQLYSFSKVPQLKMLKPAVAALKSLRSKVVAVRKKAEQVKRDAIDPAIRKIKAFEAEVYKAKQKVQGALAETNRAEQQIQTLKGYVAQYNYPRPAVSTLESLASTARVTVHPMRTTLQDVDRAGADAESKLKSYATALGSLTRLSSGLSKIQSELVPFDKKARSLDKVLSKKFRIKIPFTKKYVTFSVRSILEAPDKIAKPVVKPLTALAKKALSPLTKKLKLNIKPPKEIAEIAAKLDSLKRKVVNLANAQMKMANAAKSQAITGYELAMSKIAEMNPSRLPR